MGLLSDLLLDEHLHPVCWTGWHHVRVHFRRALRINWGKLKPLQQQRQHNPSFEQSQMLPKAVARTIDKRVEIPRIEFAWLTIGTIVRKEGCARGWGVIGAKPFGSEGLWFRPEFWVQMYGLQVDENL